MIEHYDLFAGIGGFSLAIDNVFGKGNTKHVFIERDEFCQRVLRKHWPDAEYHSCIKEFVANPKHKRLEGGQQNEASRYLGQCGREFGDETQIILTGGFPCQPFSQAGSRKGTDDDRYLWPAMFESIRLIHPKWIIAENVAGLATWNEGMVLEQVCSDLESEGYEVQPFIIPAVAVNAPHRRDRVWIIANKHSIGCEQSDLLQQGGSGFSRSGEVEQSKTKSDSWDRNWLEVATGFCRMGDGFPRGLDRTSRLKALGNAIVPQVAEEILTQIRQIALRESK